MWWSSARGNAATGSALREDLGMSVESFNITLDLAVERCKKALLQWRDSFGRKRLPAFQKRLSLLRALRDSPEHTASTEELARTLDWSRGDEVNLVMGTVAHELCDILCIKL